MATKRHQIDNANMVQRAKKMGIGKNIYNNIEIYNYLNMKQNIDLTFCTQQALDSFSSFFSQKISSYRRNTSFTKDLPISVSLKYDTV